MTNTQSPRPHPGLFLALEGPDGGGKSTQAARLATWLRGEGLDVVSCHDPGSTPVGERLRSIVLDRKSTHLAMKAEMLIYMASRAQLVEEVVRPALEAGRVVVSSRFLLSNIVYQGFAGGLDVEEIAAIGRVAIGGLFPDLTLILDVPPDVARARVGPARDRIEDRSDDYRERVRRGFLEAARAASGPEASCPYYPAPTVVIDALGDPDAVFAQVRSEVERVLALGPRA
jgi:dTMP kinase